MVIVCIAMLFSFSIKVFALPINIQVYPTQLTSLNYQIYYNGKKYLKELEFTVTPVNSRSSFIKVKTFNSYLYVESIAFGDYLIEVDSEDFRRSYSVTLDEEYHESSHLTKYLHLDRPSGELGIEFVPDSEQLFPNGNKPSNPEEGDSDEDILDDSNSSDSSKPNNDSSKPNGSSEDDSILDSIVGVIEDLFDKDSLPITGSKFRKEVLAVLLVAVGFLLWKGVDYSVKNKDN